LRSLCAVSSGVFSLWGWVGLADFVVCGHILPVQAAADVMTENLDAPSFSSDFCHCLSIFLYHFNWKSYVDE
jgi:hypothetical protein